MPRTLAFSAVQRQSAASTLVSPVSRLQQEVFCPPPKLRSTSPVSTFAHTTSFSVSTGHFPLLGFGVGGLGVTPPPHVPQALAMVKKRRLMARKRAAEDKVLEAIGVTPEGNPRWECDF